jgi:hypothetical protein
MIRGLGSVSTRIRVDIFGYVEKERADPENWWRYSREVESLQLELESARAFLILHSGPPNPFARPLRPESYFARAMEMWGFNRELLGDLLRREIGMARFVEILTRHFTLTPEVQKLYSENGREMVLRNPESTEYHNDIPRMYWDFVNVGLELDEEEWEVRFSELVERFGERYPVMADAIRCSE